MKKNAEKAIDKNTGKKFYRLKLKDIEEIFQIKNLQYEGTLEFYFHPNGNLRFWLDSFHLIILIYLVFSTPFFAAFWLELQPHLIFLEILCHLDVNTGTGGIFLPPLICIQIFLELRTPYYSNGVLKCEKMKIFEFYKNSGKFYHDIISVLPINLVVWSLLQHPSDLSLDAGENERQWVIFLYLMATFLRLLRML